MNNLFKERGILMKKTISTLLILVVLSMMLTACGKFTCAFCMEEKSGKKYESAVFGEEVVICNDCYQELQGLFGGN